MTLLFVLFVSFCCVVFTSKNVRTTPASPSSSSSSGSNIAAASGEELTRAQVDARKAMAQSMMSDIKDSILRRKEEKGLDIELPNENALSELLRVSPSAAASASAGAGTGAASVDDVIVVLFARAPTPLDIASFKENAEKMLRGRSNDKRVDDDFRRLAAKFKSVPTLHFCRIDTSTPLGASYADEYGAANDALPIIKLFVNGKFSKTYDGNIKVRGN
jgi:hypothetical protein